MWGGPARDCNGCAGEWLHLRPALTVLAKRKLNGSAQFRVGPARGTNQPVQERQNSLGRRRPRIVVLQVIRSLQPAEETILGMTDDRLLGFGKYPPFVQAVAKILSGMDVLNRPIAPGDVSDRVRDDTNPMLGGRLQVAVQSIRRPATANLGCQVRHRGSQQDVATLQRTDRLWASGEIREGAINELRIAAVIGTGQSKPPCQSRRNLDVHASHLFVVDLAHLLIVDVGRVGPRRISQDIEVRAPSEANGHGSPCLVGPPHASGGRDRLGLQIRDDLLEHRRGGRNDSRNRPPLLILGQIPSAAIKKKIVGHADVEDTVRRLFGCRHDCFLLSLDGNRFLYGEWMGLR